jgi:hypothetical protein
MEASTPQAPATNYTVLRLSPPLSKDEDTDSWVEVGDYLARSARAAKTAAVQDLDKRQDNPVASPVVLVAVPARSWRPERASLKTQTQIAWD